MGDRRLEEAGDEVNGAFFPYFSSEMNATRSASSMSTLAKGQLLESPADHRH